MIDIITPAQITFRHQSVPFLRLPKLGVDRAFARFLENYGHALSLAYVEPFCLSRRQPPAVLEGSEKGRDPNW